VEACLRGQEIFQVPGIAADASARLPFADQAFDVVLCSEVIEHVADPVVTILEAARVARRLCIFTTEQACRTEGERFAMLQFTEVDKPAGHHNYFVAEDFRAIFGEEVLARPQFRFVHDHATQMRRAEESRDLNLALGLLEEMLAAPLPTEHWLRGMTVAYPASAVGPGPRDRQAFRRRILDLKVEPGLIHSQPVPVPAEMAAQVRCPACGGQVEWEQTALTCARCSERYHVDQSVPVLISDVFPRGLEELHGEVLQRPAVRALRGLLAGGRAEAQEVEKLLEQAYRALNSRLDEAGVPQVEPSHPAMQRMLAAHDWWPAEAHHQLHEIAASPPGRWRISGQTLARFAVLAARADAAAQERAAAAAYTPAPPELAEPAARAESKGLSARAYRALRTLGRLAPAVVRRPLGRCLRRLLRLGPDI